MIGVQAQLPPAASLAFWNRTANCTTDALAQARLERRSLVRMWGQRNTVHIYRATDWPFLHSAFAGRPSIVSRRLDEAGLLGEFRRLVRRVGKRLSDGAELTYKDVRSKRLEEGQDRWVVSYVVFMELVREGIACHGPDRGNESTFVHRRHWLPDLSWSPPGPDEVFPELALRYLAAFGPARAQDLAFWFGTTVTDARRWIEAAGKRCCPVEVDGDVHWCRRSDLADLAEAPTPTPSRWPVRLLYRFDPLLLATKDKSWLIDERHYKRVWRAAAHVEAVLLVRGRIAGTWRYDKLAKGLRVRIDPFAPLSRPVQRATEREVAGMAGFLGLPLADVVVGGS